jgi:hypothetical protein
LLCRPPRARPQLSRDDRLGDLPGDLGDEVRGGNGGEDSGHQAGRGLGAAQFMGNIAAILAIVDN